MGTINDPPTPATTKDTDHRKSRSSVFFKLSTPTKSIFIIYRRQFALIFTAFTTFIHQILSDLSGSRLGEAVLLAMLPSTVEEFVQHPMFMAPLATAFALVFPFYISQQSTFGNRGKLPLPPGPTGVPLFGNMADIVRESKIGQLHLLMQRWAREYGDIFRVRIGTNTEYYLNSDRAVKVRQLSLS